MKYSIDTSAILDGWRRHYPPDAFPGLWSRLEELISNGDLRASEEVLEELKKRDDDVFEWASARDGFLAPLDDAVQDGVSEILRDYPKLVDTRRGRSGADPFVIALAQVMGCTVVTGERPTGKLHRPNIPDVCTAIGIPCIQLIDLIRRQRWAFQ